jgi:hypothetical protein
LQWETTNKNLLANPFTYDILKQRIGYMVAMIEGGTRGAAN